MSSGLERMLDKIKDDPTNKTLIKRFIALVREIKNDHEKVTHILSLATILKEPDPSESMQFAFMVFQYQNTSIPALEIIADCLKALGRHGKAEVIRNEVKKLRDTQGVPKEEVGQDESSFSINASSIRVGGKDLVVALEFTPLSGIGSVQNLFQKSNSLITELIPPGSDISSKTPNKPPGKPAPANPAMFIPPGMGNEEPPLQPDVEKEEPEKLKPLSPQTSMVMTEDFSENPPLKPATIVEEPKKIPVPEILQPPNPNQGVAARVKQVEDEIADRPVPDFDIDASSSEIKLTAEQMKRAAGIPVGGPPPSADFEPDFETGPQPVEVAPQPQPTKSKSPLQVKSAPQAVPAPQPQALVFSPPLKAAKAPAVQPQKFVPQQLEPDPEPEVELKLQQPEERTGQQQAPRPSRQREMHNEQVQDEDFDQDVVIEMFEFYWRQGNFKEAADLINQHKDQCSNQAWWKARKTIVDKAASGFNNVREESTRTQPENTDSRKSEAQKWGVYLDDLIREERPRKALNQIESRIRPGTDLEWALVAWERLPQIWDLLGLKGFDWRSAQGVTVLHEKLSKRQTSRLSTATRRSS